MNMTSINKINNFQDSSTNSKSFKAMLISKLYIWPGVFNNLRNFQVFGFYTKKCLVWFSWNLNWIHIHNLFFIVVLAVLYIINYTKYISCIIKLHLTNSMFYHLWALKPKTWTKFYIGGLLVVITDYWPQWQFMVKL